MAETIGEILRSCIPDGKAQKAVAMEWGDCWVKRGGEPHSTETLESRVSDALHDRTVGIKFLFGDARRRETTFDVFPVDAAAKATLGRLVEERLAGDRRVRLVIDATSGPQTSPKVDGMLASLKARFLGTDAVFPIVMLLTESQYDRLPRSFDNQRDRLTVRAVHDSDAAAAVVEQMASGSALVASPVPQRPYEQWLAMDLGTEVHIEPVDGLAHYRDHGKLDGLPAVTRPLRKIAEDAEDREGSLPSRDPCELRKLAFALARGEAGTVPHPHRSFGSASPRDRLAWARMLGVEASATEVEWNDALALRLAPMRVLWGRTALPHILWYAHFGTVAPVAFKGPLTLVNPPAEARAEVEGTAGVTIHDIQPTRRATLDRFFAEASQLTELDAADDRFLERLVARHTADSVDRVALELARAALFTSHVIRPRPPAVLPEWREALQRLLENVALEAALLLDCHPSNVICGDAFVALGRSAQAEGAGATRLFQALAPCRARRRDELALYRLNRLNRHEAGSEKVRIPRLEEEPSQWTQQFLEGARFDDQNESVVAAEVELGRWSPESIEVPSHLWASADREVAFVMHALRDAVITARPIALPDGKVMIPLQGGVFAEITVHEYKRAGDDAPEASLDLSITVEEREVSFGSLTELVPMYQAETRGYGTKIGPRLPRSVRISGRGLHALIQFRTSALFASSIPSGWPTTAAVGAVALDRARRDDEDEERRRREADDDDE